MTPERKFVSQTQLIDGCVRWTGLKNTGGYGRFFYQGRYWFAHRLLWTWMNGPIADGLYVCHECDQPDCLTLEHLWLGTCLDNIKDRDRKQRGRQPNGERNGQSKLTAADVLAIRNETGHRIVSALSRKYGVGRTQIKRIRDRETWLHV